MMIEPVAYRVDGAIYNNINDAEFAVRETEHLRKALGIDTGLIWKPVSIEPLYTSEQLHPRVKMTRAEFDEWNELYEDRHATTIYDFIIYVLNRRDSYPDMTNKLMCGSGAVKAKSQAKIADLIVNYNPDNPEETIEIVPDFKWFVRSKKPNNDGSYLFRSGIKDFGDYYYTKDKNENKIAYPFDTKEEAEKWTNPLTAAVQLPVEGE